MKEKQNIVSLNIYDKGYYDISYNLTSYEMNCLKCVQAVSLSYYATLFIIPARVAKKRENIARF